jgi:RNA polymerase sigma-70 factor (ECF subfamily)
MLALCMTLIDVSDTDLFEKIYSEYKNRLYIKSLSILHNHQLAEDAVSDTFFALAKNFKKVHNCTLSEILSFTIIINRSMCFKIYNREKKISEQTLHDEFIEDKSDLSFEEEMKNRPVFEAVQKLPDIYRDIIMLKYYYNLRVEEIAGITCLSEGGVKYRLSEARKLLRKALKDYERP